MAKARKRRHGGKYAPNKPETPWDRVQAPATTAARARLVTAELDAEEVTTRDGRQYKIGGKVTRRAPMYELLHQKGLINADQKAAASALLRAWEARNRTPGSAIPDMRVDGGGSGDTSEWLLTLIRSKDPFSLIPMKYRQVVSLVIFSNMPIGRDGPSLDMLRRALDWVAKKTS